MGRVETFFGEVLDTAIQQLKRETLACSTADDEVGLVWTALGSKKRPKPRDRAS